MNRREPGASPTTAATAVPARPSGPRARPQGRMGAVERWLRSPLRLASLVAFGALVATAATSLGEIELQRASGFEDRPLEILRLSGTLCAAWGLVALPTFALARRLAESRLPWFAVGFLHLVVSIAVGSLFLVAEIRTQEWIQGEKNTAVAAQQLRQWDEWREYRALPEEERIARWRAMQTRWEEGGRRRGNGSRPEGARLDGTEVEAPPVPPPTDLVGPEQEPQPEDIRGRRPRRAPEGVDPGAPGAGAQLGPDSAPSDGGRRRGSRPPRGFGRIVGDMLTGSTVNVATGDLVGDFGRRWLLRVPRYALVYLALAAIGLGIRAFLVGRDRDREARSLEVRAVELEAALSEARLATLKGQLHPHFLFNALHSVGGLIRSEKGTEALGAIASIGDLLRSSLDAGGEQFVPLARELELVERYLDVERLRLGARLHVEFDVDEALLECEVPAFITQPLVENAVKHGIAARASGGRVIFRAFSEDAMRLTIEIEDDGDGFDPDQPTEGRSGVGVAHVHARLEALFEDAGALDYRKGPGGRGTVARLTLPLEDTEPLAP